MAVDYYIRLSREELDRLSLTHLYTEVDEDPRHGAGNGKAGVSGGVTEWCAYHGPDKVSIGWDWVRTPSGQLSLVNPLAIRTNVMLVDERSEDLGRRHTLAQLVLSIGRTAWEREAARCLGDGCPA